MRDFILYDNHLRILYDVMLELGRLEPEYNPQCGCIYDIINTFLYDLNNTYFGKTIIVPNKSGNFYKIKTQIVRIVNRNSLGFHVVTNNGTYVPRAIIEVLDE